MSCIMNKEKAVIDIIQKTSKNLPQKVITKDPILKSIPFDIAKKTGFISNEEYDALKPYIEEFQLNNPQKLIKWVVELQFAGIESIILQGESTRHDLLESEISKIKAITRNIIDLDEDDDFACYAKQYSDEIQKVIADLEGKINTYISEIKRIDDLPRYKFFLQANFNKAKVISSVQRTHAALQAYFEALNVYVVLANERHGVKSSKKNNCLERSKNFIDSLEISLLLAYDKDKDAYFWNKANMLKKIEDAKSISYTINEYLLSEQETEVDFENDIIFD